jgi:YegS/Rv2252/BmrU family lipid kinase
MRKILFIVNPVAGHGNGKNLIRIINDYMSKNDVEHTIKISNKMGNVTELAKWGCEQDFTDIVAVGGDGSLVEALNGIDLEKSVSLGLLPAGTGNDFAKVLNLSKSYEECLDVLMAGETKDVDVCEVNQQRFINVCCCGIDGEIIMDTDRIKRNIRGSSAYLLSTLKALATYKAKKVLVKIDDLELSRETILIAVGNGKYIGGGMKVTPDAEIDDGLLDICIVNKLSKPKLIALFPSIFKGEHINIKPTVEMYKGKHIQIVTLEDRLLINADGNLIGTTPANIKITGKKLKVIYKS